MHMSSWFAIGCGTRMIYEHRSKISTVRGGHGGGESIYSAKALVIGFFLECDMV